jgi:hypothetical protein
MLTLFKIEFDGLLKVILLKRQSIAFSITLVTLSRSVFTGTSADSAGSLQGKSSQNSSVYFKFRGPPTEPLWVVSLLSGVPCEMGDPSTMGDP